MLSWIMAVLTATGAGAALIESGPRSGGAPADAAVRARKAGLARPADSTTPSVATTAAPPRDEAALLAEYEAIMAEPPQEPCFDDCPTPFLTRYVLRNLVRQRLSLSLGLADPERSLSPNQRYAPGDVVLSHWKWVEPDHPYRQMPYAGSQDYVFWTDCRSGLWDPNSLVVTPNCSNRTYQDFYQLFAACNEGDPKAWTELLLFRLMGYDEVEKGPPSDGEPNCTGSGSVFWRADWPEGRDGFRRLLAAARERHARGETTIAVYGAADFESNLRALYREAADELDRRIAILRAAPGGR